MVLATSWVLGWLGGRPLLPWEVNSAVKAFRALMAHRRLTGQEVGLGFLAALYFWIQRMPEKSGLPAYLGCSQPAIPSPAPGKTASLLCDPM